jgi:hypothetical protein
VQLSNNSLISEQKEMEKAMRRIVQAIAAAAFCFLAVTPSEAVTIGVEPSASNTTVGSVLDLRLVISELGSGAAPSLSTFDLDIAFDDDILSFESVTFGDPILGDQLDLSGFGSLTVAAPGPGTVNLLGLSFDTPGDLNALLADRFVLATLVFHVVGAGLSPVDISTALLGDADGDALSAALTPASVAVSSASVPEPASMWLALAGAVALSSRGRRYKRRRNSIS